MVTYIQLQIESQIQNIMNCALHLLLKGNHRQRRDLRRENILYNVAANKLAI